MNRSRVLSLLVAPALAAAALAGGTLAARAELVASSWLDFREARVRLVAETKPGKDGRLKGAIEIMLAPEYKTYWRNAGDSGVPPQFDFTGSTGLGKVAVAFPFPTRFDDGAGGTAWGYKKSVMLPLSGALEAPAIKGKGFAIALKLDFAVCGTMCIPLSGTLKLDTNAAAPAGAEAAATLDKIIAALPVPAEAVEPVTVTRLAPVEPPQWVVRLPFPVKELAGAPYGPAAFPEARGYLDVTKVEPDGEGHLKLKIMGQPEPGSEGRFGPVRLTYGTKLKSYERVIDLDGAGVKP
jgi:DsbC/DsbD-like thiol-disulfide interchange protein